MGAGRMGEADRGEVAARRRLNYYCANGHTTRLSFAVEAEVPQMWDCPHCGAPAGRDEEMPPQAQRVEPFKTHLAYVKERRSDSEGEALLAEALAKVASRRTPPS